MVRKKEKKETSKKPKIKREKDTGLFIPAGLFLGIGAGFFLNELVPGILFGLGIGFLGMAIAEMLKR
jgi:hypothetical protein